MKSVEKEKDLRQRLSLMTERKQEWDKILVKDYPGMHYSSYYRRKIDSLKKQLNALEK